MTEPLDPVGVRILKRHLLFADSSRPRFLASGGDDLTPDVIGALGDDPCFEKIDGFVISNNAGARNLEELAVCTRIEFLTLSGLPVERLPQLRKFPRLESVTLCHLWNLKDLSCLDGAVSIKRLRLLSLPAGVDDFSVLASLAGLEHLDVRGASITDQALSYLDGLEHLRRLEHLGDRLTPDGVLALQRRRTARDWPECWDERWCLREGETAESKVPEVSGQAVH